MQINTGSGCHLDADMLARGLRTLDPATGSVVLIENVGNLVCPALFDLGEAARVVIMSVTEGDDKPLKYPHMFRSADLLLLNKVDLLPYVDFDVDACVADARQLRPDLTVLPVSATKGDGLDDWYAWLRDTTHCGIGALTSAMRSQARQFRLWLADGGDGGLADADAAVVGRDPLVDEDLQAVGGERGPRPGRRAGRSGTRRR